MTRSSDTVEALGRAQKALGITSSGPIFEALLDLEEAAWSAGYEAAKAGYERLVPS